MTNTESYSAERSLDSDLHPHEISKADVAEKMHAAGVPKSIGLHAALAQHPGIALIRDALIDAFGRAPALCEFPGRMLASLLPGSVGKWPGWYVVLPSDWAADIEHLLAAPGLYSRVERDDQDPWSIVQWLCLNGRLLPGDWPDSSRRIEIDDRYLSDTLIDGFAARALVVLIECGERVFITGLPIDESLICELQAGDSASNRHPLFDATLVQVQAIARDIEEGSTKPSDPNVLRLPCIAMTDQTATNSFSFGLAPRASTYKRRHAVSISLQEDGAIGALASVVGYLPRGCPVDDGLKLRLTMPAAAYQTFEREPVQVTVLKLQAQGDAPALIAVVLTSGCHMYCAELLAEDGRLAAGLQHFVKTGRCNLVLENLRSGRWHGREIAWPSDCKSHSVDLDLATSECDIYLRTEHPAILQLARTRAREAGGPIELMRCAVSEIEATQ